MGRKSVRRPTYCCYTYLTSPILAATRCGTSLNLPNPSNVKRYMCSIPNNNEVNMVCNLSSGIYVPDIAVDWYIKQLQKLIYAQNSNLTNMTTEPFSCQSEAPNPVKKKRKKTNKDFRMKAGADDRTVQARYYPYTYLSSPPPIQAATTNPYQRISPEFLTLLQEHEKLIAAGVKRTEPPKRPQPRKKPIVKAVRPTLGQCKPPCRPPCCPPCRAPLDLKKSEKKGGLSKVLANFFCRNKCENKCGRFQQNVQTCDLDDGKCRCEPPRRRQCERKSLEYDSEEDSVYKKRAKSKKKDNCCCKCSKNNTDDSDEENDRRRRSSNQARCSRKSIKQNKSATPRASVQKNNVQEEVRASLKTPRTSTPRRSSVQPSGYCTCSNQEQNMQQRNSNFTPVAAQCICGTRPPMPQMQPVAASCQCANLPMAMPQTYMPQRQSVSAGCHCANSHLPMHQTPYMPQMQPQMYPTPIQSTRPSVQEVEPEQFERPEDLEARIKQEYEEEKQRKEKEKKEKFCSKRLEVGPRDWLRLHGYIYRSNKAFGMKTCEKPKPIDCTEYEREQAEKLKAEAQGMYSRRPSAVGQSSARQSYSVGNFQQPISPLHRTQIRDALVTNEYNDQNYNRRLNYDNTNYQRRPEYDDRSISSRRQSVKPEYARKYSLRKSTVQPEYGPMKSSRRVSNRPEYDAINSSRRATVRYSMADQHRKPLKPEGYVHSNPERASPRRRSSARAQERYLYSNTEDNISYLPEYQYADKRPSKRRSIAAQPHDIYDPQELTDEQKEEYRQKKIEECIKKQKQKKKVESVCQKRLEKKRKKWLRAMGFKNTKTIGADGCPATEKLGCTNFQPKRKSWRMCTMKNEQCDNELQEKCQEFKRNLLETLTKELMDKDKCTCSKKTGKGKKLIGKPKKGCECKTIEEKDTACSCSKKIAKKKPKKKKKGKGKCKCESNLKENEDENKKDEKKEKKQAKCNNFFFSFRKENNEDSK